MKLLRSFFYKVASYFRPSVRIDYNFHENELTIENTGAKVSFPYEIDEVVTYKSIFIVLIEGSPATAKKGENNRFEMAKLPYAPAAYFQRLALSIFYISIMHSHYNQHGSMASMSQIEVKKI
jgi:hypothetical protein